MKTISIRRIFLGFVAAAIFTGFHLASIVGILHQQSPLQSKLSTEIRRGSYVFSSHRKLLDQATVTNRVGNGESCSLDDVVVYQGATAPLPSGIPTYTVQVLNVCTSGCAVSGIHLSCGWFSSARTINPKVFKRLNYDDCLVNDGEPIFNGGSLSFQYANTFRYPLYVSSATCSPNR